MMRQRHISSLHQHQQNTLVPTLKKYKIILLHTHIDILNLISLKNVTWHLTFRSINRWAIGRIVISTTRDNYIISLDDFILHCENKYRRTEYGSSLDICCQIWTRPNNYVTVLAILCNKTIITDLCVLKKLSLGFTFHNSCIILGLYPLHIHKAT